MINPQIPTRIWSTDYLTQKIMVKEWHPFGWISLDMEIVMVIKMTQKELCGLGVIG